MHQNGNRYTNMNALNGIAQSHSLGLGFASVNYYIKLKSTQHLRIQL
jgi:hypothetical protein